MKTYTYNNAGKLAVKRAGAPLEHEEWMQEQGRQQADDLRKMREESGDEPVGTHAPAVARTSTAPATPK